MTNAVKHSRMAFFASKGHLSVRHHHLYNGHLERNKEHKKYEIHHPLLKSALFSTVNVLFHTKMCVSLRPNKCVECTHETFAKTIFHRFCNLHRLHSCLLGCSFLLPSFLLAHCYVS